MKIRIGNYKNTKIGILDTIKKIYILNFPWTFDYSTVVKIFNQTGINNKKGGVFNKGFELTRDGQFAGTINYAHLDTAPTAVLTGVAGNINVGTHVYVATFITAEGEESIAVHVSSVLTVAASSNAQATITVPFGPSGTASRNIYRSLANTTSPLYLLGTISDNTTATFTDNLADSSISTLANPPSISNNYEFDYQILGSSLPDMSVNDGVMVVVDIPDEIRDDSMGLMKVSNVSEPELPPTDPDISFISDTNLATTTTTYFYEIPQSVWRNLIINIIASCSGTGGFIKLYRSLDSAAAVPANGVGALPSSSWNDCTEEKLGYNEISVYGSTTYNVWRNLSVGLNGNVVDMPDRYLLSWRPTNTANSLTVNIRKF